MKLLFKTFYLTREVTKEKHPTGKDQEINISVSKDIKKENDLITNNKSINDIRKSIFFYILIISSNICKNKVKTEYNINQNNNELIENSTNFIIYSYFFKDIKNIKKVRNRFI